jgi:hypothetical protein
MPNIDLSILNQRQTPAFYADTLANRPAAGFVGRIFVSTNTFAFYRDNGTGWDLIGGPGTGTITGSGANGQVSYWNGASTITGSNNLFFDAVNGHLGIGTVTPGTALDVKHDQSTVVQLEQITATNDIRIAFINSGVGLWRLGAFYNAGANDFGLFDIAAAAQPITVKRTTGQVLIGTSTVGSGKLVVASATGDNGVQIVGATAPSLRIDNAESGPTKRAGLGISTASNNFIQGSADQDFCIFNGTTISASPILFGIYDAAAVNVQEAARISAARNFLLGTKVDSGQKLIVNGTALISNSLLLGQTGVTNAIINSNDGMYFNIDSDSSGGSPEFMFGKQRNGAGSGGTTFMTISNAGNVGINTSTPTAAKLVVLSSDTTITMFGQNIDSSTTIGNSFVSRFRNGFDGNGLYSLTSFQVQNAAGTDQISFIGAQSVTGAGNYSPNTVIGVRSGASTFAEYMRIVGSTGNLLIGTTTDNGYKLNVQGSGNFANILNVISQANIRYFSGGTIGQKGNATLNLGGDSGSLNDFTTINFGYDGPTYQPAYIGFIVTGSSSNTFGNLLFATRSTGSDVVPTVRLTIKSTGIINMSNVPTSAAGLVSGDIYQLAGVLNIVP